jgi:hypothetical protein
MAHDPFDDFVEDAQELFGLNENEASDLLADLEQDYDFDYRTDDLTEYGPEAIDLLGDVFEQYDAELADLESEYELDPDWPDDEWLDDGDWYEVSGEYEEAA